MNLAEELGQVDSREVVDGECLVKKPVGLAKLPVVAKQEIEPKSDVEGVVEIEGILGDEIGKLVPLPLVCQPIGKDAEVTAVSRGAVGVASKAILKPAVQVDRRVLNSKESLQ